MSSRCITLRTRLSKLPSLIVSTTARNKALLRANPDKMYPGLYLALRCSPVLLATSSLTFSFSEYHFLRPYLDLPHDTSTIATSGPTTQKDSTPSSSNDTDRADRAQVNNILRAYIHRQFPTGFATILTLYPLTWATAIANLRFTGTASTGINSLRLGLPSISRKLYVVGLIFSVGHMLWGPKAKDLMEEIGGLNGSADNSKEKRVAVEKEDNIDLLRCWLRLHVYRSILADFPSWACFTAGFYFMLTR